MARTFRAFAAAAAAAAAAAGAAAPQLSALVQIGASRTYTLVRVLDSGQLTPVFNATFPGPGIMSGVTAASGDAWWCTPPFAQQASEGLLLLNVTAQTTTAVPVTNPAGAPGAFVVGEMAASDVPGDAVGLLAPDNNKAWLAVAELSPSGGAPRVRLNLSAEGAGFAGIAPSFATFDPASRTLFFAAAVDGQDLLLAAPLDGSTPNPSSLWNVSLTMDAIAMVWASAIDTVVCVGIVAAPQTWGMQALDRATGTWRPLVDWSKENFFLSGLGQITVDPTGRFVTPVVSDAAGHPTLPVVDVVAGKEVRRITVKTPETMIADVAWV